MRGAIPSLSSFYPAIFAPALPPCFPDLRLPIQGSRFENKHGTREQDWIMAKITKRAVDALQPDKRRDVFAWDSVSISAEQLPCTYGL